MSILKRFIRIPIKIYSVKQKELTGRENTEDTYMKLNPLDISRYYPSTDEENDEVCVKIVFKDGGETCAYLTIEHFERLLESFF